ncbi:hypothetical protein ACQRI3_003127 [Morganella morganii]
MSFLSTSGPVQVIQAIATSHIPAHINTIDNNQIAHRYLSTL